MFAKNTFLPKVQRMLTLNELCNKLDSGEGIDGVNDSNCNPASRYWFIGLEYGDRGEYGEDKGSWLKWEDKYYPKIREIMDAMDVDCKDTFLANLYPIRKPSTSANVDVTGLNNLDDYYAFCDLHGRKVIRENLKKGHKKIIICIGLTHQWSFMMQLANGYKAEYVKTNEKPKLVEIKFANHPHIDRLIIIKHISRYGTKDYLENVGKYIKKI